MTDSLPAMRKTYLFGALDNGGAPDVPSALFREWLQQVRSSGAIEANAMAVSTMGEDGTPSSRTVLLKGVDEAGLIFYTNYDSQKGREIAHNPAVALLFYWPSHERQVRITGTASRISGEESDLYFQSRPIGNRIGAVISPQSTVIPDRAWLEQRKADVEMAAHTEGEQVNARPSNWGGYRFSPSFYEFWQGRPDRIHDRLRYRLENDRWIVERLAP